MYTVNFYKNSKLVNQFEYIIERLAIDCLRRHADNQSLEVREDFYYAYSEGNKPEIEIEIVREQ